MEDSLLFSTSGELADRFSATAQNNLQRIRSKKREDSMKRHLGWGLVLTLLLMAEFADAAKTSGRWELLGRRDVDFRNDHDRIEVGRHEGKFRQIQFKVKDAPIEVSNLVVTFSNDQKFSPKVRHRFPEGSGSRVIDLPGERKTIKQIDFDYRSINRREGRGKVEVYAR